MVSQVCCCNGAATHTGILVFLNYVFVEPSDVQFLKNPNPLKDVEAFALLGVAVLV